MTIRYYSTIRLPVVLSLPGTASMGDCVVLNDGSAYDGLAHVYDGTSWLPLGVGAPTGASGVTSVNFGALPGKSSVSVAITGQAGIQNTSKVIAWVQPVTTADHSGDEHWAEELQVSAGTIVPTTGFTIYVKCNRRTYGQWNVGWKWE